MSLERYREIIQAGSDGRERVSIIDDFTSVMIQVGKAGIDRYTESKVDRKRGILNIDESFIQGLIQNHSGDLGAVEIGIDVVMLRNSLVERRFSVNEYVGFWNAHVGRYPFLHLNELREDKVEEFSHEQWRQMIALANKDVTLASFFDKKNRHLLPADLNTMISNGITDSLVIGMLPSYREAMEELMADIKQPGWPEVLRHKERMDYYDGLIQAMQADIDTVLERKFGSVVHEGRRQNMAELLGTLQQVHSELS